MVHQEAKEVVELQKVFRKVFQKKKRHCCISAFCFLNKKYHVVYGDVNKLTLQMMKSVLKQFENAMMSQRALVNKPPPCFVPFQTFANFIWKIQFQQWAKTGLYCSRLTNRGLFKSVRETGRNWTMLGKTSTWMCPHLDLVLLPCIFNRLENVPCAPASHLQSSHILSVPALDQQSCSDRWQENACGISLSCTAITSFSQGHELRVV